MRALSFFISFLLLGVSSAAQELVGPDHTFPRTLASFEIVPAQEASWHIVSPSPNTETYQVDTSLAKLYFASPDQGRFTIIAGIVTDGKPRLLIKTFSNGEEYEPPIPIPPISSLESWIKTQLPILVKSTNLASEVHLLAGRFEEIVRRIDEGNIKTIPNAHAQLHIALIGTLAQASPTAVNDWTPFLSELSLRLEKELDEKINDLAEIKKVLLRVGSAMKSLELPKGNSATLQKIDNPNSRGTSNRMFRNIFTQ